MSDELLELLEEIESLDREQQAAIAAHFADSLEYDDEPDGYDPESWSSFGDDEWREDQANALADEFEERLGRQLSPKEFDALGDAFDKSFDEGTDLDWSPRDLDNEDDLVAHLDEFLAAPSEPEPIDVNDAGELLDALIDGRDIPTTDNGADAIDAALNEGPEE